MAAVGATTNVIDQLIARCFSQFQPYREYASECSYCRRAGNRSRVAYGMQTGRLTALDYEEMLDRGFVRSGKHIYVPSNDRSCCPNICIRAHACAFMPSKAHMHVLRRTQEYLSGARPIVLPISAPGATTDVLEALLQLAEAGRADEAARSVCVFRAEGDAAGAAEDVDMDDAEHEDSDDDVEDDAARAARARRVEKARKEADRAVDSALCAAVRTSLLPHLQAALMHILHGGDATAVSSLLPHVIVRRAPHPRAATAAPGPQLLESNVALTAAAWHWQRTGHAPAAAVEDKAARKAAQAQIIQLQLRLADDIVTFLRTSRSVPTGIVDVSIAGNGLLHFTVEPARDATLQAAVHAAEVTGAAAVAAAQESRDDDAAALTWTREPDTGRPRLASGKLLDCINARTRGEKRVLWAYYRMVQKEREERGKVLFRSSPFYLNLHNDMEAMEEADSSDDDAFVTAPAATATTCLTREQRRATAKAEKLTKSVEESRGALMEYLRDGIGSHARALRRGAHAPVASTVASSDDAMLDHNARARKLRNGMKNRAPPVPGLVRDATSVIAETLPFGTGPVRMRVQLRRPVYSTESHELYTRFNMSLHRGRPRDNTKTSYMRHLIVSPIMQARACRVGFVFHCGNNSVGEWMRDCAGQPGVAAEASMIVSMASRLERVATALGIPELAPDVTGLAASTLAALGENDGVVAYVLDALRTVSATSIVLGGIVDAGLEDMNVGMYPLIALPTCMAPLLLQLDALSEHYQLTMGVLIVAIVRLMEVVLADADAVLTVRAAAAAAPEVPPPPPPSMDGIPPSLAMALQMQTQQQVPRAALLAEAQTKRVLLQSSLTLDALYERLQDYIDRHKAVLAWLDAAILTTLTNAVEMVVRYAPDQVTLPAAPPGATEAAASLDSFFERAGAASVGSSRIPVEGWDLAMGYGSFFHEYRINDVLVAVSVLDILPTRVSSVYFFYNPDFRYLQLGKLSALVELWLTRQIALETAARPAITGLPAHFLPMCRWWDANFYAHMCATMYYKRQYTPSQLLCPVMRRGEWVDVTDDVLRRLDVMPAGPLGRVRGASGDRDDADTVVAWASAQEREELPALQAIVPHMMVPLSGRAYVMSQLSPQSCELLQRGYLQFVSAVGPAIARTCTTDANWAAQLAGQSKDDAAERTARHVRKQRALAVAAVADATSAPVTTE